MIVVQTRYMRVASGTGRGEIPAYPYQLEENESRYISVVFLYMSSCRSFYEVLGVSQDASIDEGVFHFFYSYTSGHLKQTSSYFYLFI